MYVYEDEQQDSSPKVKPEHLDCPLVANCSTGHKLTAILLTFRTLKVVRYLK